MKNIGAHVSVNGGFHNGIAKANEIGAHAIQFFGSSPRRWSVHFPSDESINQYKDMFKKSDVNFVFLHAPYLINLGTNEISKWNKSIKSLSEHLEIANILNANGLIFHVGSTSGNDEISREESVIRAAKGIKEVLKKVKGNAQLIMENSAGGGKKLATTIDDLAKIFKNVNSPRFKICLDTAHTFESGVIQSFETLAIKEFFDKFDFQIGLENLVVLHINDSQTPCNSHRDIHDNIGKGYIGMEGFKNLAKEVRIKDKPWILEVPGFDHQGPDKKNIDLINSCFH
jgi:apurinic endonuclease APN1